MANIGKWGNLAAVTTVFNSELNSLATNTLTVSSVTIANQTNLDIYADFALHLATATPTAGAYCNLYILESLDGTLYPVASGTQVRLQPQQLLCTWSLATTSGTIQDIVTRNVVLPPASFKLAFDNQSGVTFAASATTVKMITYDLNLNG